MPITPVAAPRDPIEGIANRLAHHCFWALQQVAAIEFITSQYDTDAKAMAALVAQGLSFTTDPTHMKTLISDAPQLRRCMVNLSAIKSLARKVFDFNFAEDAPPYVFKQEVCFSYACKFLVAMGPLLEHFSNRPNRKDVINAELAIAMRTPVFTEEDLDRRKTSLSAPAQVSRDEARSALQRCSEAMVTASSSPTLATVDLLCHETLTPTPPLRVKPVMDLRCHETLPPSAAPATLVTRQIPPEHPPRPRRSCRR